MRNYQLLIFSQLKRLHWTILHSCLFIFLSIDRTIAIPSKITINRTVFLLLICHLNLYDF